FLRFGNPDFQVGKPFIFQGRSLELDLGAEFFGHLADGRAEAAGAAIRYRMIQTAVARLQNDIDQLFLGDGVADLDGAATDAFRFRAELHGGKGSAVNAVTAG